MTQDELMKKLEILNLKNDSTRNSVVCSSIGHSKIVETCFGQVTCARCDDVIGDQLMGVFSLENHVIVGHECGICRENYQALTWQDTLFAKEPFVTE